MKNKHIFRWLLPLGWMGCIFYLSHQPGSESSELSSNIVIVILSVIGNIVPFDIDVSIFHMMIRKSAHFFAYFILGMLFYWALRGKKIRWLYALFLSFLYAVSDEIHQLFIPGRSGEFRDVLIDSCGALVGIVFIICLSRLYRKKDDTI